MVVTLSLLLEKDYEVFGIIRRNSTPEHQESRIDHLVGNGVETEYGDLLDVSSLERMIRTIQPDEIYNIADKVMSELVWTYHNLQSNECTWVIKCI